MLFYHFTKATSFLKRTAWCIVQNLESGLLSSKASKADLSLVDSCREPHKQTNFTKCPTLQQPLKSEVNNSNFRVESFEKVVICGWMIFIGAVIWDPGKMGWVAICTSITHNAISQSVAPQSHTLVLNMWKIYSLEYQRNCQMTSMSPQCLLGWLNFYLVPCY